MYSKNIVDLGEIFKLCFSWDINYNRIVLEMKSFGNNASVKVLRPNEVHLWLAFPDEIQDTGLLSEYQQLLIPEEEEKQRRFCFPKHRHQYLVARALLRTTLFRYTGIKPRLFEFSNNQYGRPELILHDSLPPIRFNLSHTDGLIACAVVLKQDIGVDVEDMERRAVSLKIADRFFSKTEVDDLHQIPESRKRDRFYDYWTLKESYIKARGRGLSLPLEQFSFHLSETEPLRISFDPRLSDDPDRWQFWLLRPTKRHKVALSVSIENQDPYELTIKKTVPLLGEEDFPYSIVKHTIKPANLSTKTRNLWIKNDT